MWLNVLSKMWSYFTRRTAPEPYGGEASAREHLQHAHHCARTFSAFTAQSPQPHKGKHLPNKLRTIQVKELVARSQSW